MSFLKKLFGSRDPEFSERVWTTTDIKWTDLAAQIRAATDADHFPIVVYHFPATGEALRTRFATEQLAVEELRDHSSVAPGELTRRRQQNIPLLLHARILPHPDRCINPTDIPGLCIYMAEHHPLPEHDERILHLARLFPPQLLLSFTALDEPWLAPFGIERIRQLLEKLDVDESEVISHPLIDRSLKGAREKISAAVEYEKEAGSCAEWMERNYAG